MTCRLGVLWNNEVGFESRLPAWRMETVSTGLSRLRVFYLTNMCPLEGTYTKIYLQLPRKLCFDVEVR